MFAFLLIMCSTVHSGVQCLPPQEFKTLESCVRVGAAYRKVGREAYYGSERGAPAVRCVQVKK